MRVVPLYAALLAIGYVFLAFRVIGLRRRFQVAVGDGRKPALKRAIRVHGNFAEYVPIALLLLAFMEVRGAAAWSLHGLCALLLVGRLIHAIGVRREDENLRLRVVGMVMTFTAVLVSAVYLLVTSVGRH